MLYKPIQPKATQAKKANFMLKRKNGAHQLFLQSADDLARKLSEFNHAIAQRRAEERAIMEKILKTKNESLEIEMERSRIQQEQVALLTQHIRALEKSNAEKTAQIKLLEEKKLVHSKKRPVTSFFSPTLSSTAKQRALVKKFRPSKKQPPMM